MPVTNDTLTLNGLNAALGTLADELDIEFYEAVGSTNDLIKLAARSGAPEGKVIIANEQTAGRGRLGRSFNSPAGTGLYMSILLKPHLSPKQSVLITAAAAAAVTVAIEEVCGTRVSVKWVNDIFYGNKKLCGILTEGSVSPSGDRLSYAVLGIGLNIYEPPCGFPPEIAEIACALYTTQICGLKNRLAAVILKHFFRFYRSLPNKSFLEIYRSHSAVIGKKVRVISGTVEYSATAVSIDDDCALTVKTDDGTLHRLSFGEISLRL